MSFYQLPSALGGFTDTGFGGGRRSYDDIGTFTPMPLYGEGALKPKDTGKEKPEAYLTGNPLGNLATTMEQIRAIEEAKLPFDFYRQQVIGDISAEQSLRQAKQFYPLLSAAGRESTERALSAGQRSRAFAEGLPSNVQAIVDSIQKQRLAAQSGEAGLMRAVADQQQAATQGASIAPYYGQVRSA
jgi:hypothetical protein